MSARKLQMIPGVTSAMKLVDSWNAKRAAAKGEPVQ
jgi:hypothetical protein